MTNYDDIKNGSFNDIAKILERVSYRCYECGSMLEGYGVDCSLCIKEFLMNESEV